MSSVARQNQSSFGMTIAVTLALVAGLLGAQDASAKPARGVAVSDRVQAQSDLCDVSGGTFESRDYYGSYTNGHQFKKNVTTCTGGKNPQTCTNTKSDTTCSQSRVIPSSHAVGGGVAIEERHLDGAATSPEPTAEPGVVDDGTVIEGAEPVVVAEPTDEPTADPTKEVIAEGSSEHGNEMVVEPVVDDGETGDVGGDVEGDSGDVNDLSTEKPDRAHP